MKVELRNIDAGNIEECEALQVAEEQAQYIASNIDSLKEADANSNVARPFAVYIDDKMVGFTMFAFDEDYEDPNDRYWLWRFMIDRNLQGKGYGTLALREIISYFKENGAHNIKLSTKESNVTALSLYHNFGFQENGEMNDGEIVLNLNL
ncbi:MAG: GNAT family N-acetyltransferase [Acetatifactor sp.]|nr:GNAT family N-acetyltransferase [Acetatifactor sp.]